MKRRVNIVLGMDIPVAWWVYDKIGIPFDVKNGQFIAIGYTDKESGELVAGMVFSNYTGNGGSMHLAVAALPKCGWYDDQTRWEIAHYAFEHSLCKCLYAYVAADNKPSRGITARYGFTNEYTIEEGCDSGDLIIYKLTREQAKPHLDKLNPEWFSDYKELSNGKEK